MQLRIARHTERLDDVVAFYRDGIGLTEVGAFHNHHGYDGVFLEVPGSGAHIELTAGGKHRAPAPHPESLLVLYVGDDATLQEIAARLDMDPVSPENPYWAEHGLTFADPDGSASYWSLKFGDDRRRCGFVAKDDFRPTQRGL